MPCHAQQKKILSHHVVIAAQCLFDEGGDAGEKGVEAPVLAEMGKHDGPHVRRGQNLEPRSGNLHLKGENCIPYITGYLCEHDIYTIM